LSFMVGRGGGRESLVPFNRPKQGEYEGGLFSINPLSPPRTKCEGRRKIKQEKKERTTPVHSLDGGRTGESARKKKSSSFLPYLRESGGEEMKGKRGIGLFLLSLILRFSAAEKKKNLDHPKKKNDSDVRKRKEGGSVTLLSSFLMKRGKEGKVDS